MKPIILALIPIVVGVIGAIVTNPDSASQSQAQHAKPPVVAQR